MLACEASISSTGTVLHRKTVRNWECSNPITITPTVAHGISMVARRARFSSAGPTQETITSGSGLSNGSCTSPISMAKKGKVFRPSLKHAYSHNGNQSAEERISQLRYSISPLNTAGDVNLTTIFRSYRSRHHEDLSDGYGGGRKKNVSDLNAAKPPNGRRVARTVSCRVVGCCGATIASANQQESCCKLFLCSDRFQTWLEEWRHKGDSHRTMMVDMEVECNTKEVMATTRLHASRNNKSDNSTITQFSNFLSPLSTAVTIAATAQRAPNPRVFIYTIATDVTSDIDRSKPPCTSNNRHTTMRKRCPLSVSQILADDSERTDLEDFAYQDNDDFQQLSSFCRSFDKSSSGSQCWIFDHSYVYLEGNMGNIAEVNGDFYAKELSTAKHSSDFCNISAVDARLIENSMRSRLTTSTQTDASTEGAMYRRASYLEQYALERLRQMNKEAIARARRKGRVRGAARCVWRSIVAIGRRLRVFLTFVLDARPRRRTRLQKPSRKKNSAVVQNTEENKTNITYQPKQNGKLSKADLFVPSKLNSVGSALTVAKIKQHHSGMMKWTSNHSKNPSKKRKEAETKKKIDNKERTAYNYNVHENTSTPNSQYDSGGQTIKSMPMESYQKLKVATRKRSPTMKLKNRRTEEQKKDESSLLVVTCFV